MKTFSSKIALFLGFLALSTGAFAAAPASSSAESGLSWFVQFAHRTQLYAGDVVTATITAATALPAEVSLSDLHGNAIWKKSLDLRAGRNALRFRLADLPAGNYLLVIQTDEGSQTRPIAIR